MLIRLIYLILFIPTMGYCQYDSLARVSYQKYATFSVNYKSGLIKLSTGDTILKPEYRDIDWFSQGYAHVCKNSSISYIDTSGKFIVPLGTYQPYRGSADQFSFHNGRAIVHKDGKYGAIDLEGELAIPLTNRFLRAFNHGLSIVEENKKRGLIDTDNKVLFPIEYDRIWVYAKLIILQKADKMAIATLDGELLSEFIYDEIRANKAYNGAVVKQNGKVGFLGFEGEVLFPCIYDRYRWQRNGITWFDKDGALYMLDKNGSIINSAPNGLLIFPRTPNDPVGIFAKDSVRYFDINGKSIGGIYTYRPSRSATKPAPYPFNNGMCVVFNGSHCGLINAKNEILIPFEYSFLAPPSELETCIAQKGKLNGVIDINNQVIMPFKSRPIKYFSTQIDLKKLIALDQKQDTLSLTIQVTAKEAIRIAKDKKLFYSNEWNLQFNDYPILKAEKGKIYWEIISIKTGYTKKGDCANTNGCSIVYRRVIKINATNGKVIGKKDSKSIFPNYE